MLFLINKKRSDQKKRCRFRHNTTKATEKKTEWYEIWPLLHALALASASSSTQFGRISRPCRSYNVGFHLLVKLLLCWRGPLSLGPRHGCPVHRGRRQRPYRQDMAAVLTAPLPGPIRRRSEAGAWGPT
jgi:hypothetical protein